MKKIAISCRTENHIPYEETWDALSHDWKNFLKNFNLIPIYIPNIAKEVKYWIKTIKPDGVILTGGNNYIKRDALDKSFSKVRNITEHCVIDYVVKNSLPLLGVCRGMHVINSYFGGKISKDITCGNIYSKHVNNNHQIKLLHPFLKIMKNENLVVNSFHNQGIKKKYLSKKLQKIAYSIDDELIEFYSHITKPILGIQWHPERKNISNILDKEIFKSLFNKNDYFWLK